MYRFILEFPDNKKKPDSASNADSKKESHEGPDLKERYKFVVEARKFHYENFNKWMTYFYVALGSISIAYFTIVSKNEPIESRRELEIAISLLGFFVSILWYWSAKGYYYWALHFIRLVNYYEQDVFGWPAEQRVAFVFTNKHMHGSYLNPTKAANVSTSKIAVLLAFIVTYFWGFLATNKIFPDWWSQLSSKLWLLTLPFISILLLSAIIPRWLLNSDTSTMANLRINHPKRD